MPIIVRIESPRQPEVMRLLAALDAHLTALYPPESNHLLDLDSLCAPDVRFFVARDGAGPVGCVALRIVDGYGEVKRMFVDPAARRRSLGRTILERIEREAQHAGLRLMRLETFDALLAFYRDALGWKVAYSWGGKGELRGACLTSEGMSIVIAEPHPAEDRSNTHGSSGTHPTVHLRVDNLDERYREVSRSGVALFPPEKTHWGTRWFVVRDPDGNLIAFEQRDGAQAAASLEELHATVERMEARLADSGKLWHVYVALKRRFEKDLGGSPREVALAKSSALMVLQGAAHASKGT